METTDADLKSNKMQDFILKVKSFPCLWDTHSIYFRDFHRKTVAWETVALECRICSAEEAKSLWRKIRDSHREAMRRRRISQVLPPWKYEDIMEFLLPQTNVEDHDEDMESHLERIAEASGEDKILRDEAKRIRTYRGCKEKGKREPSVDSAEEKRMLDSEKRTKTKHKFMDQTRGANEEALKDLFSGLYQKTVLLPKPLQLRVQREIFEAVMKAEEDALTYVPSCSNVETSVVRIKEEVDDGAQDFDV